MVARLNHHACLALWCGDNELIGALTWFPESRKDRDRYLVSYDRLNRTIEAALHAVAAGGELVAVVALARARWPSATPGMTTVRATCISGRSGTRGATSTTTATSAPASARNSASSPIRRWRRSAALPTRQDFNIAAPVMESHQKNAGGNARIAETMFRYFRFPVDFENFVYLSQVQQGLAIKTAVTHWRSLKPHCMGTLYWQLNDTWPVCSWASLDHGGNWKLLHHMARAFFAPVIVSGRARRRRDRPARGQRHAAGRRRSTVTASAAGDGRHHARRWPGPPLTVPTDAAVTALTLPAGRCAADEVLAFTWDRCRPAPGRRLRAAALEGL